MNTCMHTHKEQTSKTSAQEDDPENPKQVRSSEHYAEFHRQKYLQH